MQDIITRSTFIYTHTYTHVYTTEQKEIQESSYSDIITKCFKLNRSQQVLNRSMLAPTTFPHCGHVTVTTSSVFTEIPRRALEQNSQQSKNWNRTEQTSCCTTKKVLFYNNNLLYNNVLLRTIFSTNVVKYSTQKHLHVCTNYTEIRVNNCAPSPPFSRYIALLPKVYTSLVKSKLIKQ